MHDVTLVQLQKNLNFGHQTSYRAWRPQCSLAECLNICYYWDGLGTNLWSIPWKCEVVHTTTA